MSYATLSDYIAWTGRDATSATSAAMQMVLDTAAEAIDEHCFRSFTPASSATSADRTYTVQAGAEALFVDDFVGAYTVTVDGDSWSTSAAPAKTGRPSVCILGDFWRTSAVVVVSAQWGWPSTPSAVKQANLLLAAKLDQRRQSPSGIERGSDEIGFIRILGVDKDVESLLRPFVRVGRSFA